MHTLYVPIRFKLVSIFPNIIEYMIHCGGYASLVTGGNGEPTDFLVEGIFT